jgi:hypothetical protein
MLNLQLVSVKALLRTGGICVQNIFVNVSHTTRCPWEKVVKMNELFEKLAYAKKAVIWLVENPDGWVDFHGLVYWSGEVVRLREEIKKGL